MWPICQVLYIKVANNKTKDARVEIVRARPLGLVEKLRQHDHSTSTFLESNYLPFVGENVFNTKPVSATHAATNIIILLQRRSNSIFLPLFL